MRKIAPPALFDCVILNQIIASRHHVHRTRMSCWRMHVHKAYGKYAAGLRAPQPIGMDKLTGDDFRGAYSNKASPMETQRGHIFSHFNTASGGMECPYCLVSEATTLDHALPQTAFPEFAVLSKNLVPCCGKCNNLKGDDWQSTGNGRLYPHAYYDTPDDTPLITCTIVVDASGLVTIVFAACTSGSTIAVMYSEFFKKVLLAERFRMRGASEWDRFSRFIQQNRSERQIGLAEVRARVGDKLAEALHAFGEHYWGTALWRAVSALDDQSLDLATRHS